MYKKCCENYNGILDITNSCIFCKSYNKVCYFCGNTNMTWYNTGEGGDGEFMTCDDHEYRNGELSIYADEAIKKYPVVIIEWNKKSL